jgi:lysophospholipase L1-like esterase
MHARFAPAICCLTLWLGSVLSPLGSTLTAADHIKAAMPTPQTQSWWSTRHARAVARLQQGPVDLLFIGDSITQGWEEDGRRVWDTFYGRRRAVNLGFNSDQTDNVLWRLHHGEIDGITPKLAIVMIGTNNTTMREDPPDHTAAGIQAVLTAKLYALLGKSRLFLNTKSQHRLPLDRTRNAFPPGSAKQFRPRAFMTWRNSATIGVCA